MTDNVQVLGTPKTLHPSQGHDPVNHPSHYAVGPAHSVCSMPIECIDVTREMNFNVGNAVKYLWRAGKKDPAKHIEDLQKARWYIQNEIERLEEGSGA